MDCHPTAYFVPDEAVVIALLSAARSGVKVSVVLPARYDACMTDTTAGPTNAGLLVVVDATEPSARALEYVAAC